MFGSSCDNSAEQIGQSYPLQRRIGTICVFGGAMLGNDPDHARCATVLGAAIAAAGIRLVYGGGCDGLMGQVAIAAAEAGGTVVAITPQFLIERMRMLSSGCQTISVPDMSVRKQLCSSKTWPRAGVGHRVGPAERWPPRCSDVGRRASGCDERTVRGAAVNFHAAGVQPFGNRGSESRYPVPGVRQKHFGGYRPNRQIYSGSSEDRSRCCRPACDAGSAIGKGHIRRCEHPCHCGDDQHSQQEDLSTNSKRAFRSVSVRGKACRITCIRPYAKGSRS